MADRDGLKPASEYPEAIYLQRTHEDGSEMLYPHDATWTETSDCGYDIKYIRADIASPQPAPHAMPDAGNPALQKLLDSFEIYNGEIVFDYQAMYEVRDALLAQPAAVEGGKFRSFLWDGDAFTFFDDAAPSPAVAEPVRDWKPTPENINALPEPIRKHIHDLSTLCDPQFIVQENARLRDENESLQKMYRKAADAAPHWYDSPQASMGGKTARELYAANPDYAHLQPVAEPARKAIDAQGAEVIHQVQNYRVMERYSETAYWHKHEWRDARVDEYKETPEKYRRIVYSSPLPAATLGKAEITEEHIISIAELTAYDADANVDISKCFLFKPANLVKFAQKLLAQQPAASDVRDAGPEVIGYAVQFGPKNTTVKLCFDKETAGHSLREIKTPFKRIIPLVELQSATAVQADGEVQS